MGTEYRLANHSREEYIRPYFGLESYEQSNVAFMWSYLLWPNGPWVNERVSFIPDNDDGKCDKKEKYVWGYTTPKTMRYVEPKYTELDPDRKNRLSGYLQWMRDHGLDWEQWVNMKGYVPQNWVDHREEWEEYYDNATKALPNRYLINHDKKEYVTINTPVRKFYAPYMWFCLLHSCNTMNYGFEHYRTPECGRWGKGKALPEVSFDGPPKDYKDISDLVLNNFNEYYRLQTGEDPPDMSDEPMFEGVYTEELVVRAEADRKHQVLFWVGVGALAFFIMYPMLRNPPS